MLFRSSSSERRDGRWMKGLVAFRIFFLGGAIVFPFLLAVGDAGFFSNHGIGVGPLSSSLGISGLDG